MKKLLSYVFILIFTPMLYWSTVNTIVDSFLYLKSGNIEHFSEDNATALDITADSPNDFFPEVNPGVDSSRSIKASRTGDFPLDYRVEGLNTNGSLCPSLSMSANKNGDDTEYEGGMGSFLHESALSSTADDWLFKVSLNSSDPGLQEQTCSFDLKFLPKSEVGQAYSESDGTTIHSIVTSGRWADSNYKADEGDVVINEIMWMGSSVSAQDEWIELRNMTGVFINLSGWKLKKLIENSQDLILPENTYLPPNGFLLIARYDKNYANTALAVKADIIEPEISLPNAFGSQLVLEDEAGLAIDRVRSESWPAGEQFPSKKSMERTNSPGDGLVYSSWQTCGGDFVDSDLFWNVEGKNYGTPKAMNSIGASKPKFKAAPIKPDEQPAASESAVLPEPQLSKIEQPQTAPVINDEANTEPEAEETNASPGTKETLAQPENAVLIPDQFFPETHTEPTPAPLIQ